MMYVHIYTINNEVNLNIKHSINKEREELILNIFCIIIYWLVQIIINTQRQQKLNFYFLFFCWREEFLYYLFFGTSNCGC